MPTFLLLLLGLTAGCVKTQDSSEGPAVVASAKKNGNGGGRLGDPCEDQKCDPRYHTVCNKKINSCVCHYRYPVDIDGRYCLRAVLLGKPCTHHDQCRFHVENSLCREYSINITECQCRDKYEPRTIQGYSIPRQCFADLDYQKADVPKLLGLGLGLSMLSALICFVLKIFSRARFARPRRYADARINPPLTVSETYAAFALAASNSATNSPARHHSLRSTKSASSSRRPSYASLHALRPGGSRRPSQASMASSSGDLREGSSSGSGRVHHYLYMRAANFSLTSDTTNTTTGGTSDSSPRTPKSTEQLLAVYHSVPESAADTPCQSPKLPQPSTSHTGDRP